MLHDLISTSHWGISFPPAAPLGLWDHYEPLHISSALAAVFLFAHPAGSAAECGVPQLPDKQEI